jgi:hypothetical protein
MTAIAIAPGSFVLGPDVAGKYGASSTPAAQAFIVRAASAEARPLHP